MEAEKNTEQIISKSTFWSADKITPILMAITAVGILATTIIFEQEFWKVVPLFVSLVIALLNSKVNRKGLLLGGLNSILYALVFLSYKLYASMIYALLVSCPMQLIAFIRWNRRPSGESTMFNRLSNRMRILLSIAFLVCWIVLYLILLQTDSGFLIWDNTVSLLGILASILTIFALIEYTWLSFASSIISIILYAAMLGTNPEQITYLIYSIYSAICIALSVIRSTKLYNQQQKEKEALSESL